MTDSTLDPPRGGARKSLRAWLSAGLVVPSLAGCGVVGRMDWSHIFSRQGWQRTDMVMETLALQPGDVVADLGAGDGYFSFHLAEAVGPGGRVYAVDVDPAPLAKLRREIARRGVTNIEVVEATADDPSLPDGVIDQVFLCNAYHHFEDRVAYFARLQRALAPGARVAVIDGRPEGFATWVVPKGHWLEPGVLEGELSAAGYRLRDSYDFLPLNTFDVFERAAPSERAEAPSPP
ncbi:MAG: class I SAM-dependent methyltransferase [Myxococcota bacterium]